MSAIQNVLKINNLPHCATAKIRHSKPRSCQQLEKEFKRMGTHTISNSSTFRGWLESMGVDDMIFDPCGCIFGETEPEPVPIPGARPGTFNRQMSQRRSTRSIPSNRASTRNGKAPVGRTQSHETQDLAENHSSSNPFATILNIVGVSNPPPPSG